MIFSYLHKSHRTVGVFSCLIERTAVVFVDGSVYIVTKFSVHTDGDLVTCSDEQINKKPFMFFSNSFKVIHQQFRQSLFSAFGRHSHSGYMSVPLFFTLLSFDFTEYLILMYVR